MADIHTVRHIQFLRLALIGLLLSSLLVSGCARPTSDFGRADRKFYPTHDWIMPLAGAAAHAGRERDFVSRLNYTERDGDLRDAAWNLVLPAHHNDWLARSKAELMRTRILVADRSPTTVKAYHRHLRRQRFASSDARWNAFLDDVRADLGLIDPFYDAAHAVVAQDRKRIAGRKELEQNGRWEETHIGGRIVENDQIITWALASLEGRYAAYHYTFQRLMAEEPPQDARTEYAVKNAITALHAALSGARADLNYDSQGQTVYETADRPLVIKG